MRCHLVDDGRKWNAMDGCRFPGRVTPTPGTGSTLAGNFSRGHAEIPRLPTGVTEDVLEIGVAPLAPEMPRMVLESPMNTHLRMLTAGAVMALIATAPAIAMPRGQATPHDHAAGPPAQAVPVDPPAGQRTDMKMRGMAMDDQIAALTGQMNTATGQARIDAMARLLTALVEQRSMMMRGMKMMQEDADARQDAMQRMCQMMGHATTNAPPADIKK